MFITGRAIFVSVMCMMSLWQAGARQEARIPYVIDSRVVLDGVVEPGEYGGSFLDPLTGMSVHWEHNGTALRVGLVMTCQGWLSVGFGPRGTGMDGSDMVVGYVNVTGASRVVDEVGVGRQHYPDTERGGRDDVLAYAGGQAGGNTTIEFEIPLVSGDPLDTPLEGNSTYGFFLGYQASSRDVSMYHTAHSPTYDVLVEAAPGLRPPTPAPFPWEAAVAVGVIVVAALAVLRYLRRPRVIRFKPPSPWRVLRELRDGLSAAVAQPRPDDESL